MSYNKLVNSEQLDNIFTDIANSIRSKNGETVQYAPEEMSEKIEVFDTVPIINDITRGSKEFNSTTTVLTLHTGLSEIYYFFMLEYFFLNANIPLVFYSPQKSLIKRKSQAPAELTSDIATVSVSGGNITIEIKSSLDFNLNFGTANKYYWIACGKL